MEHTKGQLPSKVYTRPTSPDPARERRLAILEKYLTNHRFQRVEATLSGRIAEVAVVVDGIYDLGNAAAIMRTCDGLGLHNVHFVETEQHYKPARRTSQGAHKWLSVQTYDNPVACAKVLHEQGYVLAGTSLEATHTLEELDVSGRIAVAFGSERDGLSKEMMDACDVLFRLDMHGMVQSYNVSVAAAVTMYDVLLRRGQLRAEDIAARDGGRGDMSPEQLDTLREVYYRLAVKNAEAILERELGETPPPLPEAGGVFGELL